MWGPLGMVMRARRSNNYFRACDVSEAERWGGENSGQKSRNTYKTAISVNLVFRLESGS